MPTVSWRTRLEAKGGAEARAVVEAPALLDLPWTAGLRVVVLARGTADAGARGQRRGLVANGLGRPGIVHPDPIPEANFTAGSKEKTVRYRKAQRCFLGDHDGFSQ